MYSRLCLLAPGSLLLLDGHGDFVAGAFRVDAVDAEDDVPFAGEEGAADVAGGGVFAGDVELRLRGAAPAAEAGGVEEVVAAGVEDADVDDVAGAVAERRGDGVRVAVGDVDARGAGGHAKGQVEVGVLAELLQRDVAFEAKRVVQGRPPASGRCVSLSQGGRGTGEQGNRGTGERGRGTKEQGNKEQGNKGTVEGALGGDDFDLGRLDSLARGRLWRPCRSE